MTKFLLPPGAREKICENPQTLYLFQTSVALEANSTLGLDPGQVWGLYKWEGGVRCGSASVVIKSDYVKEESNFSLESTEAEIAVVHAIEKVAQRVLDGEKLPIPPIRCFGDPLRSFSEGLLTW